MIDGISFLRKRRFPLSRNKFKTDLIFSPILIGPCLLVLISSLLIKSIQNNSGSNDFLSHLLTGFVGYFLALIISYVPLERLKNYVFPL